MNLSVSFSVISSRAGLGLMLLLAPPAEPLHAQVYSIEQVVIANGGGASAGDNYSLTGTIGQPEAGVINGGGFALVGGFWSDPATQGGPLLRIDVDAGNSLVISWPSSATGFTLQHNDTLNPLDWITAPESVTDNGARRSISVTAPPGTRFYRLIKP